MMDKFLKAKGALPLKEGARPPEVIIAEMRGRGGSDCAQHWFERAQRAELKCLELTTTVAMLMEQLCSARLGCRRLSNKVKLLAGETLEYDLEQLLSAYAEQEELELKATAEIKAKVTDLQSQLEEVAGPFRQAKAELEPAIKAAGLAIGNSFKCEHGQTTYRSGYIKVNYDTKKLDGYAAANKAILKFRTEKWVLPVVTFSIFPKE